MTESPAPPWAASAAESPTCFGVDGGALMLVPALFYAAVLLAARAADGPLLATSILVGLASTWSFSWAGPSLARILCGYSNWFLAAVAVIVAALLASRIRRRRDHPAESEPSDGSGIRGNTAPNTAGHGLDLSPLTEIEAGSITPMLEGLTSAEIAAVTGRSPSTIRNTQARAYRKLGFSSAAELKEHCAASRQEDSAGEEPDHTTEAARGGALADLPVALAACFALLPVGVRSGATAVPIDFWRSAILATICGLALGSASNAEKNAGQVKRRFAAVTVAIIVCAARFFALMDAPVLCDAAQLVCAAGFARGARAHRPTRRRPATLGQRFQPWPWPPFSAWRSRSVGERPIPGTPCCLTLQPRWWRASEFTSGNRSRQAHGGLPRSYAAPRSWQRLFPPAMPRHIKLGW